MGGSTMEIVPVLDLKGGLVVRAHMGQRDQYRPIKTPLSPTSDPIDVTFGLLSVHPFKTLYIADLDAIEGTGEHRGTLTRLKAAFPLLTLWIDNGIADRHRAEDLLDAGLGHLVLGSETQVDVALMRHFAADARVALSLDFRGPSFQGPPELLNEPTCWPQRVIVMTLARVGSSAGPDLERLGAIRRVAPEKRIFAAGGVRDAADLGLLKRAGIAGALVASCLHDGRLHGPEIARL
jgi:phosphoribosylformimino-5-aminoimidazole carboxamide ribotide isomerase